MVDIVRAPGYIFLLIYCTFIRYLSFMCAKYTTGIKGSVRSSLKFVKKRFSEELCSL